MWRLQDSVADLALSLLILLILTIVAVYVIVRVRRGAREDDASGIELLSKFRDVHAQGGLSDAEFRTIKTRLADRVMDELKDKEEES